MSSSCLKLYQEIYFPSNYIFSINKFYNKFFSLNSKATSYSDFGERCSQNIDFKSLKLILCNIQTKVCSWYLKIHSPTLTWLLASQRREVLKESKYLSGCYPLKHTGHKSEDCNDCKLEMNQHVNMFKEAGSQTESQQLKEDNLGFRGVNMHTTRIRQHIEFQRRLQE